MTLPWSVYSILAVVCFVAMLLVFKKLSLLGVPTSFILLFVFLFGGVFYVLHVLVTKESMQLNIFLLLLFLLVAGLSYLGNLLYLHSFRIAPNPGYATAITGLQGVFVIIASVLLFGSDFSWTKVVGAGLGVIALVLLVL